MAVRPSSTTGGSQKDVRITGLEIIDYDSVTREVYVHLYASKLLTESECQQVHPDLEGKRDVDTNFWVGLFDFPMIDNTRLSDGERCAASVTTLNDMVLNVTLAYFPGSRASLKDKPYFDELYRDLVRGREVTGNAKPQ